MPAGTPVAGSSLQISVAANTPALSAPPIAGTYSPCNDLTTISKNSTRNSTNVAVFMKSTQYVSYSPRQSSYSLNGLLSVGDSGQDLLRAAEAAEDVVFLKVLYDGVNGFSVPCLVGSHTGNVTPEGRVEITYELGAVGSETIVGTGPI